MAAVNAPEAYVRPKIVESLDEFILEGARHPCLEIMEGVSYIANDVKFERGMFNVSSLQIQGYLYLTGLL